MDGQDTDGSFLVVSVPTSKRVRERRRCRGKSSMCVCDEMRESSGAGTGFSRRRRERRHARPPIKGWQCNRAAV